MRLAYAALAALALAPTVASAQEPDPPEEIPPKARALAMKGRAFHEAGDYNNAIIAFKEAYVLAPSPGLLFNLGQAYRLAGDCDDAALMYRRYLATGPAVEGRTIAEGHLETVERCAHKAALGIPQDEGAPAPRPAPASPGDLFVASGTTVSRKGEIEKDIGLGLVIGGGVAVALATYYAYDAHDASNQVADGYAMGAKWKDLEPINTRGERSATLARVFGIGGGVAVAGGVALYLLGRRTEQLAPIAVAPAKHGATVNVSWRF